MTWEKDTLLLIELHGYLQPEILPFSSPPPFDPSPTLSFMRSTIPEATINVLLPFKVYMCTSVRRIRRQPFGCGDTGSLAIDVLWDQTQGKECHQHAEDAKGFRGSSRRDPAPDEKSPGKADDGAEAGDHDERVPGNVVVRVENLISNKGVRLSP